MMQNIVKNQYKIVTLNTTTEMENNVENTK